MTELYWISEDEQTHFDMTGHESEAAALEELLGQCGTAEQREAILAGSFVWETE